MFVNSGCAGCHSGAGLGGRMTARVQLGRDLEEDQLDKLMAFYEALEGDIPQDALRLPVLPASRGDTPKPSER